MMTCEECKNVIEEYLDGTISDAQLAELKAHTETCESCREDFGRCELMQDAIKEAFASRTAAVQAKASLVARLSAEPNRLGSARQTRAWLAGRRAAVAAGIVLAVGLFLGFALGRAGIGRTVRGPVTAQVPIRIGQLEGTVLVRHQGSDLWQALEPGSNVHLGDTFYSAARSACRLEFEDKSTIDLNRNSKLVLKRYNDETQFFLEHGECTASLVSPHGPFFISTPHGRMEAMGTEFTVTVTDE